jgi:hypothetical protein
MEIKKLTQTSVRNLLNKVKTEFDSIRPKYLDEKSIGFNLDNDLLKCVNGVITISDINLDAKKTDFENAKLLFEKLNNKLTPEDADDERLWTYLTHFIFYRYTKDRWINEEKSSDVIRDRFFYEGSGRLVRTRNAIARLWWIPYLTYNPNGTSEQEKWKYTEAAFSKQEVFVSLFERNMGSYINVRKSFLNFIIENNPPTKEIQFLARKINNLGGVYLLPSLSEEKLTEVLNKEHEDYKKQNNK